MGQESQIQHQQEDCIPEGFSSFLKFRSLNALIMLTSLQYRTFATKLKAGATKKTKDSIGRRLGVKRFGGEEVYPGEIIIRQRGF